jgi:iron-sulfur cluster assembly protein
METKLLISKNMTIDQVFKDFPDKSQKLKQIMTNAGLNCGGCCSSDSETIEEGIMSHGMSQQDLDNLLRSLNKALFEAGTAPVTNGKKENISFTKYAAEKCKSYRKNPDHMFKVTLHEGSCGWTYQFKFHESKNENEEVLEDNGVKILINKNDVDKLKGMVIDYVDGLQDAGFKVTNPNVKGTCGCGSSSKF